MLTTHRLLFLAISQLFPLNSTSCFLGVVFQIDIFTTLALLYFSLICMVESLVRVEFNVRPLQKKQNAWSGDTILQWTLAKSVTGQEMLGNIQRLFKHRLYLTHVASLAEAHLRKCRLVLCSTFAGLLEQGFFNVLAPQACSNPRDHANTQRLESAISSGVPGDRLVPN